MASVIVLLIILVLNIVLWILLFSRLRKEFSPDAVLYSIREEVDKLIIEINKVSDRDITLIDARRNGLKQLLEEIDKKLALYGSLQKAKDDEKKIMSILSKSQVQIQEDTSTSSPLSVPPPVNTNPQPPVPETGTQIRENLLFSDRDRNEQDESPGSVNPYARAASVYKRNEIKELNTEMPDAETKKEEPIQITFSSDPISPKKDKRRSVLKMYHEGFTAEIIAEKLKIPVREVSLIIDLNT